MARVSAPKKKPDANAAQVLAEHYQKTNELTYELRQQRDKIFLFLLLTLGGATLFNFDANSSNSILFAGLGKFLGDNSLGNLKDSPIKSIVVTLLLGAVFYLMSNLYQRTASVLRNYQYLGLMEQEIRVRLGIQEPEISFSREGNYYWRTRERDDSKPDGLFLRWRKKVGALNLTKNFYTIFLASLLILSFALRIFNDVQTQNWLLVIIDALIAVPTLVYLNSYAQVSREFDKPATELRKEKK